MKEQSETFDVLFSLFFHTDETVLLGEKSAFPLKDFTRIARSVASGFGVETRGSKRLS